MENEFNIHDYLLVLKRRWLQVIIVFALSLIVITFIIFKLPDVYRSEGVIAIESPLISEDIVKQSYASRYANESLDKVKEKIYSRDYLLYLNEAFSLFPKDWDSQDIERLVSQKIKIYPELKDASTNQWSGEKITVALKVSVDSSNPKTAYEMASEVVQELVEENEKVRKTRITETTTYLATELERLKNELDMVESRVAEYKQKHANSLPEHQEMYMANLEQLQINLKDLDREYKATQEELRYLDVELTTTEASMKGLSNKASTKNSELQKAQAELDNSLGVYTESHPTIKALRRKIALLKSSQPANQTENEPKDSSSIAAELALSKIRTQIQAAKVRLDNIASQQNATRARISELQKQVVQIPQVERGLVTLQRDYDNAKGKYDEVKAKQINAKIAENLQLEDKSERFILKIRPELPRYRVSPERKLLMLGGIAASIAIGALFAFLLEWLDPRVRGQEKVKSIIDMRLLAVIPYIETNAEINKKQKIKKILILVASILLLIIIAIAVHFFIIPLNSFFEINN